MLKTLGRLAMLIALLSGFSRAQSDWSGVLFTSAHDPVAVAPGIRPPRGLSWRFGPDRLEIALPRDQVGKRVRITVWSRSMIRAGDLGKTGKCGKVLLLLP